VPLLEEDVIKKREKVAKIVNSAPRMSLDKPFVTDVDYYNIELSWSQASLPPDSTPTSFMYVAESHSCSCFRPHTIMRSMRTIAMDDLIAGCVSLSFTRVRSAKTAEWIEVQFGAETPGSPKNIVLDGDLIRYE